MTDIKAKIVEFELFPHPDPEVKFLSIAKVKNTAWQCVVKTEDLLGRDLALYIPLDAEVPTTNPIFSFLDKKNNKKPSRIKSIRLRGQISQGLLLPAPEGSHLGDDLTEVLKVKRWEPIIPKHLSGNIIREPGACRKYTSIENWKNYPEVFQPGDLVRVTEKIHGTNFRFGFMNDGRLEGLTWFLGSHKTLRDPSGGNLYSEVARNAQLREKVFPLLERFSPQQHLIVFGEIYGAMVQDLNYGHQNASGLSIFDVLIDGVYQSWEIITEIAAQLDCVTVPLLYSGPFNKEKILAFRDGMTTISASHLREGVVVTAVPETTHHSIGRKIIKIISDDFLLRKGATDV